MPGFCPPTGLGCSPGHSFWAGRAGPLTPIYHRDWTPRRQHRQQPLLWACKEKFTPWAWRCTDARPVFLVSSWPLHLSCSMQRKKKKARECGCLCFTSGGRGTTAHWDRSGFLKEEFVVKYKWKKKCVESLCATWNVFTCYTRNCIQCWQLCWQNNNISEILYSGVLTRS